MAHPSGILRGTWLRSSIMMDGMRGPGKTATNVLPGMAPPVTAWFGFRLLRRHGDGLASSLAFASVVMFGVTVFVGFFRAAASGGF